MKKRTYLSHLSKLMMILFAGLLTNCGDDAPSVSEENEEEFVTTVHLTFTQQGSNTPQTFSWKSTEGAQGTATSRDQIALEPNSTYDLSVQLLNESENPAEDITEEIEEQKDDHLLIFLPDDALNLTYSYSDQDTNSKPVGLSGTVTTTEASNGNLRVVLRHEPSSKDNPQDLSSTGGTTDVDISFEVAITDAPDSTTEVSYTMTFNSTWSATSHPVNFPGGPHFSPLIGAVHNASFTMWASDEIVGVGAAEGMKLMAETGGTSQLRSYISTAISEGTAKAQISGSGIGSPGSTSVTFKLTEAHPQVSIVSMLAPSPDWFIGVRNLSLFENGEWVDSKTVDLVLYDAGTDDGEEYNSSNQDSNPKQVISRVTSTFTSFSNGEPHVGTFTFQRNPSGSVPDEPDSVPDEPDSVPDEPDSVPDEPDSVPDEPDSVPDEPDSVPDEPNSTTEVSYTMTFNSTWSAISHPVNFPGGPHFSPLIGAVHNASFTMWASDEIVGVGAAEGMENMAETGGTSQLRSYISTAISEGTAKDQISGSGIGSPGSTSVMFMLTEAHPQVSIVSMLAPSPDWFIGVRNLSLFENSEWVDSKTVDLVLYDAGTDDGEEYNSSNQDSNPKQVISRVTSTFTSFSNGEPQIGTFTFQRNP